MTLRSQFRALFAAWIVLSMLQPASAAQRSTAEATLQGVVRHARTGEPIAGARITLASATATTPPAGRGAESPLATATTDRNGEFVLAGLEAGPYKFTVMNNGFVRYESKRIELAASQTMKDLVVRMTATGTLSGRVSSTAGRPLVGINVTLLRRIYNTNGSTGFTTAGTARTNDLGEYRMFWVTPGRYFVSAEARAGGGLGPDERYAFDDGVRRGLNEVVESYAQTFFPGVTDFTKASTVDLEAGTEVRGIDFTLARQQLFTIRGRVIDPMTGQPPPKATVSLSQRGLTGSSTSFGGRSYDPATGIFELPNLAPGRYGVGAQIDDRMTFQGPPVGVASASREIVIGDAGVEDVALILAVPPAITGRLKVEGQLPAGTAMERLRVNLTSPTPSFFGNTSATSDKDGNFRMNSIAEGTARVTISTLPAGFYLKEARLDGVDVLKAPSRFAAAGMLEVTISANAGQVDGRVLDAQNRPVSGIEAVLIPSESRDRPDLFKRAITNSEGRFSITSVAPGNYKLFSWERLEANTFFDEQVLSKFEQLGTPVRVAELSRENVELRIIPEETLP